jgi:hypothetical protein
MNLRKLVDSYSAYDLFKNRTPPREVTELMKEINDKFLGRAVKI